MDDEYHPDRQILCPCTLRQVASNISFLPPEQPLHDFQTSLKCIMIEKVRGYVY